MFFKDLIVNIEGESYNENLSMKIY